MACDFFILIIAVPNEAQRKLVRSRPLTGLLHLRRALRFRLATLPEEIGCVIGIFSSGT
jgi:hypothetical protein